MDPGKDYTPIINAIWGEFVNNAKAGVTDAHGRHMLYWGPTTPGRNTDIDTGLIANADGSCGGWAGLLLDCLRAEVSGAAEYAVTPLQGAYTAPDNVNTSAIGFNVSAAANAHVQGQKASTQTFLNHAVVELSLHGPVYDPSYAAYFGAEQNWDDASVANIVFGPPGATTGGATVTHQPNKRDVAFTIEPV